MKAVMYGAGSIGRGFIGALFSEIGYEVVFIDVNDDVIHLINKEKTYPQIIMNEEQPVRDYLLKALPEDKHALFEKNVGLVETSIGRMVPPADPDLIPEDEHPLAVRVEPYDFLPVDKAAFKGMIPEYKKIIPYEPFHYYLERKLYVHNMAHVTTAFLGQYLNKTYIHEAAHDIYIQSIVRGCMTESCMMLSEKYQVPFSKLNAHMNDLLHRFKNSYLRDTVTRVARDPMRKLQPSDRLIGAARSCEALHITPVYLSFAIALALSFMEGEDALNLMETVCKIKKEEPIAKRIIYFYNKIKNKNISLDQLYTIIDNLQSDIQGETI